MIGEFRFLRKWRMEEREGRKRKERREEEGRKEGRKMEEGG